MEGEEKGAAEGEKVGSAEMEGVEKGSAEFSLGTHGGVGGRSRVEVESGGVRSM